MHNWFPSPQQMSDAAQLRRQAYSRTTMQQALGMVVLLTLAAGFVPFLVNWMLATRFDSALPLARLAEQSGELNGRWAGFWLGLFGLQPALLIDLFATAAGLPQAAPGWLSGLLSAMGTWLSWPSNGLFFWIGYGGLVMMVNRFLGATCTLQRFFAATGYAAVPLLLLALSPVYCLGGLATLISIGWAAAIYVRANQEVTQLPLPQAAAAVLLPAAILALFLVAAVSMAGAVLAALL